VESGRGFRNGWMTGKKGGQEGKNGLRRFAEGEGNWPMQGGGDHPSDHRAAFERWNNFALSRRGLAARVPSRSPGTSTLLDPPSGGWESTTSRVLSSQGNGLSLGQLLLVNGAVRMCWDVFYSNASPFLCDLRA
jgi:hypothetical protein